MSIPTDDTKQTGWVQQDDQSTDKIIATGAQEIDLDSLSAEDFWDDISSEGDTQEDKKEKGLAHS